MPLLLRWLGKPALSLGGRSGGGLSGGGSIRSPKLASIGVGENSVSTGLAGLRLRLAKPGEMGKLGLFLWARAGRCSWEEKPPGWLLNGSVSLEAEVEGRLGIWLARWETRASQLPLPEVEVEVEEEVCCGSRP